MTHDEIEFENQKYSSKVLMLVPLTCGDFVLMDASRRRIAQGEVEDLIPIIKDPPPYVKPTQFTNAVKLTLEDLNIELDLGELL